MKTQEIRELTIKEMNSKLNELKESLFNLRFQHEISQLENPQAMKRDKRSIARLKTIINETQA